jgi:hypothetical protein
VRFSITWREGAYYVSVPEYDGGEVVTADEYDRLRAALEQIANANSGRWGWIAHEALRGEENSPA